MYYYYYLTAVIGCFIATIDYVDLPYYDLHVFGLNFK